MALQKTMGAREWALLLILSVLWGGSFFFIGVAVKELPPLTIMMLRVGLAALTLHVVLRTMGQWMPRDPRIWLAFAGMGLLNNAIPQTLIVWGQTQIPSGLASILNATTPLFGVLVAHFFTTDERMTGKKLAGVIVGFVGAAVMVGPAALQGLGHQCVGASGHSPGFTVLWHLGRLWAALQADGGDTHDDGHGAVDGFNPDAHARCPDHGPVLDAHPSQPCGMGRHCRACHSFNGAGLSDLLPHPGLVGGDQPACWSPSSSRSARCFWASCFSASSWSPGISPAWGLSRWAWRPSTGGC